MLLLAATATHTTINPGLLIFLLAAGRAVWYAALCAVRPFKRHRRCQGLGRLHAGGGRIWKPCKGWRGCRSTGVRLRLGRRVYAYLKRTRQAGQRRTY